MQDRAVSALNTDAADTQTEPTETQKHTVYLFLVFLK